MVFVNKVIDNRRGRQRYPTYFAARIEVEGRSSSMAVVNISDTGCLLRGDTTYKTGTVVKLSARDLEVPARVVRVVGQGLGVRFSYPINALAVIRQNQAGLEHFRTMRSQAHAGATATRH